MAKLQDSQWPPFPTLVNSGDQHLLSVACRTTAIAREQFPKWQGQLFISTLVDQDVKRVTTDAFGATLEESLFSEFEARIRAIVEDDQGALYLLTDSNNGSIIKIERSDSPVG